MVAADELLHFGLKETRRKFLYNMWTKAQCAAVYITVIIKNGNPFQSIKLALSCIDIDIWYIKFLFLNTLGIYCMLLKVIKIQSEISFSTFTQ